MKASIRVVTKNAFSEDEESEEILRTELSHFRSSPHSRVVFISKAEDNLWEITLDREPNYIVGLGFCNAVLCLDRITCDPDDPHLAFATILYQRVNN